MNNVLLRNQIHRPFQIDERMIWNDKIETDSIQRSKALGITPPLSSFSLPSSFPRQNLILSCERDPIWRTYKSTILLFLSITGILRETDHFRIGAKGFTQTIYPPLNNPSELSRVWTRTLLSRSSPFPFETLSFLFLLWMCLRLSRVSPLLEDTFPPLSLWLTLSTWTSKRKRGTSHHNTMTTYSLMRYRQKVLIISAHLKRFINEFPIDKRYEYLILRQWGRRTFNFFEETVVVEGVWKIIDYFL